MSLGQAIAFHLNGQRIFPQAAKLRAQPVAHDAIDHKRSVDLARSGKHFAARQVTPFVRADDAAGLEPAIFRVQVGDQIGSRGGFGSHLLCAPHYLDNLGADAIHFQEVGAHAFQHDLVIDVDHVGVADLAAVDHIGHLHARLQFVGLRLHRKDADLAGFEVVHDFTRQIGQRTRRKFFQNPGPVGSAQSFQFMDDAGARFPASPRR